MAIKGRERERSTSKSVEEMQSDEKSEFMPRVDLTKDKSRLKYCDLMYMKQAEEVAVQRALRYRTRRNKCTIAGFSLGALALSIYLYTIHAVRQETFLDNFDEPEKIVEKPSGSYS